MGKRIGVPTDKEILERIRAGTAGLVFDHNNVIWVDQIMPPDDVMNGYEKIAYLCKALGSSMGMSAVLITIISKYRNESPEETVAWVYSTLNGRT